MEFFNRNFGNAVEAKNKVETKGSRRVQNIIGFSLIILGILIVLWAIFKLNAQRTLLIRGERANGVFIGYHYSNVSRSQRGSDTDSGFAGQVNTTTASPKISFTTKDEREITFINSASLSPELDKSNLEVIYDPQNPENAIVNDFFGVWGWVLIIGGFGVIFNIVGFLLWKVL